MSLDYRRGTKLPPERIPVFPLLLLGADLTVFFLLILSAFLPEYLFSTDPGLFRLPSLLPLIILISNGGAICHYLRYRYRLPFFFSLLIPLLTTASVLWPQIIDSAKIREIHGTQGVKLFIIISGWFLSDLLTKALYELSLLPRMEADREEEERS